MHTDPPGFLTAKHTKHAKTALGWKLSGAGGGGYLVLVSQSPVTGAIQLKIRRQGE